MKMLRHPMFWVVVIVAIVIMTANYFENKEDIERHKTKQAELALKLEQVKSGSTNAVEMIINRRK